MTFTPADTFTVCAGSFHCQEVIALLAAWASTDLPQHICLIVAPRHMHYLDKIDYKMHQLVIKSLHESYHPGVFIVKAIVQLSLSAVKAHGDISQRYIDWIIQ